MKLLEDRHKSIERIAPLMRSICCRDTEKVANHLLQWWTERSFEDEEVRYAHEEVVAIRTATLLVRSLLATATPATRKRLREEMERQASGEFFVPEVVASGEAGRIVAELLDQFGLSESGS